MMFGNIYNQNGLRGPTSQPAENSFLDNLMGIIANNGNMDIASILQNNPDLAQKIMDAMGSGGQQVNQLQSPSGQTMFTNFNSRQKKESPLQKANDAMSIGGMLGGIFGGGSGGSGGGFGGFFGG